jgi:hypothetical protein
VESNPLDECTRYIIDLLNMQDVQSVNTVLEGLATVHHDKVRYGQIRAEFLLKNVFLTKQEEADKAFLEDDE